jgi:alpha-1,6-mannosyltransferase
MANADIFLHPNPREPFGIAPLEAMACGTALVAPNEGGVTSYANQANAWLAEPTPAALANAITAARTNPQELLQRTAAARLTAEQHRWSDITVRHLQLYREIHAVTRGRHAPGAMPARTWSTPGDALGRELAKL